MPPEIDKPVLSRSDLFEKLLFCKIAEEFRCTVNV
jgi:hypothetical protein